MITLPKTLAPRTLEPDLMIKSWLSSLSNTTYNWSLPSATSVTSLSTTKSVGSRNLGTPFLLDCNGSFEGSGNMTATGAEASTTGSQPGSATHEGQTASDENTLKGPEPRGGSAGTDSSDSRVASATGSIVGSFVPTASFSSSRITCTNEAHHCVDVFNHGRLRQPFRPRTLVS